jgi:hypothetical protein
VRGSGCKRKRCGRPREHIPDSKSAADGIEYHNGIESTHWTAGTYKWNPANEEWVLQP